MKKNKNLKKAKSRSFFEKEDEFVRPKKVVTKKRQKQKQKQDLFNEIDEFDDFNDNGRNDLSNYLNDDEDDE